MQTAVNWMIDALLKRHSGSLGKEYIKIFEQAKEMEKQQIIDAANTLLYRGTGPADDAAQQYYNETYGSKGSDSTLNSSLNSTLNSSSQTEISDDRTKLHWKTSLVVHTPKISDDDIEEAAEKGGFYDRVLSASPPPNTFTFSLKNNEPIIVLSEEGFKYKEELIEDAGEVYKLFKEFLIKANRPTEISDEEIEKAAHEWCKGMDEDGCVRTGDDYDIHELPAFIAACKWYREQLKKKQ